MDEFIFDGKYRNNNKARDVSIEGCLRRDDSDIVSGTIKESTISSLDQDLRGHYYIAGGLEHFLLLKFVNESVNLSSFAIYVVRPLDSVDLPYRGVWKVLDESVAFDEDLETLKFNLDYPALYDPTRDEACGDVEMSLISL